MHSRSPAPLNIKVEWVEGTPLALACHMQDIVEYRARKDCTQSGADVDDPHLVKRKQQNK